MLLRIHGRTAAHIVTAFHVASLAALVVGVSLVGWAAFVYADSAITQWVGSRALAAVPREAIITRALFSPVRSSQPRPGAIVGNLAIPRLGLSLIVLEGTEARTLDKSIGRIEGTGDLGEAGNIGIAGHRNTHFRKLERIRRGDEIVLTAHNVEYRYVVEWMQLFKPTAVQVLDPSHGPAVTIVTCFPFEYVGNAPLRFVIRALPDDQTRRKLLAASIPAW